jgi:hypothetical protein
MRLLPTRRRRITLAVTRTLRTPPLIISPHTPLLVLTDAVMQRIRSAHRPRKPRLKLIRSAHTA